ncbi:hypothetical protein [Pedobacter jeongneungensis]|uniref:hypothetical protein n=1 Tax=Pedobacter jeongneungensis TaxID=947309 RepID=UPI0004692BE1|nr:hypothetical protein [Pedobacter jeongneungensis]
MHRLKLTLIFCLLCAAGFAQKKKQGKMSPLITPPTIADYAVLEKRMACMYRNKYSPVERLKFFPFNQHKTVMLISFEPPELRAEIIYTDTTKAQINTSVEEEVYPTLLEEKQKLDLTRLKEKKILSALEMDKLTDILYNFGYTSTKSYKGLLIAESDGYRCYEPRNAIVFLDENGLIAEYIEICFKCHRRKESSEKIKMGEFCDDKYDLLRKYFRATGIKYGTAKRT